jgi:hypothetical protein
MPSPIEVVQELAQPLATPRGDRLPAPAIRYTVSSDIGGRDERELSEQPTPVIQDSRGALSALRLGYSVAVPDDQPSGLYRGMLRFRLSGTGGTPPAELSAQVEIDVKDIVALSVRSLDDAGQTLKFSRTGTGRPQEVQHLLVTIRTNMGRPYQVRFGLDHPLVLDSGETLPPDALTVTVEHQGPGRVVHPPSAAVGAEYQPLYESDSQGAPDSFVVHARLEIPPDAPAGEYRARLRFSITMF